MAEFPIELIIEILLRLSVVDLLRFRCVSKEWRNLIDSPNFVKFHLNLPNKPQSLFVVDIEHDIYYCDMDSVSNANSPLNLKDLSKPCSEISNNCRGVVGHVNGLVCCVCDFDRGVILWNPSTRKHIQVPVPEKSFIRLVEVYWGFGYDRDSDDYKVVALGYLQKSLGAERNRTLVWIYSLRSGSWRSIDDFPYAVSEDGVFSNGALHWKVCQPSDQPGTCSYLICALHLGKLEYSLVPPPDHSVTKFFWRLGVLDGCLCAVCVDHDSDDIDLWVMKEYGLKESWTKLFRYHSPFAPLAYTEDGNELLFVTCGLHKVVSYKCKTRAFKIVIHISEQIFSSVVCIPSLVCPRSDL